MVADVFRIAADYEEGKRGKVMGATLRRYVLEFMDEAKRSAHLEDARAGCYFCGLPDLFRPAALQAVRRGGERWRHSATDAPEEKYLCERPEVWDALSLLGGK